MSLRERLLYHQVHPLKLAVDPMCGILALFLLWRGRGRLGLAILTVPTAGVSALLVSGADLRGTRDSRRGAYMRRYQTPPIQFLRFAAVGVALWGAWRRRAVTLSAGLSAAAVCWLYGLLRRS